VRIGVNTLFLIPGEVGGTETYLRQTLLAIAKHFPEVELVLFTNKENDSVLRKDLAKYKQAEFVQLDFKASNRYARIIREQLELPFKVRKSGVDVLWSAGYTAPFFSVCPQAVTIHDMQYKRHPEDLSFLARCVSDVMIRMACWRCDSVIAVSQFTKEEIIKFSSVRKDRVFVIHEGVDSFFQKKQHNKEVRSVLKELLSWEAPYILCVSNTYPHKNVHMLVDAFSQVMDIIPHNLVLVGKPHLGEKTLQISLEKAGGSLRIHRFDGLPLAKVRALYHGADLFVLPSVYEGFGLPILESMMAGVPVIATRKASIPEVAGKYARYVESLNSEQLAKTIIDVTKWDDKFRSHWIEDAKRWALKFSWEKTAEKTMDELKAIVN
jgi:glycosyltransferase involved in cell wall biosynthesis